jgi:integrase
LPDCTSHGLRKAISRRLAEAGKSPHEIMSVTGHSTLKEVERYTRAASQKLLARRALESLGKGPKGEQETG